MEIEKNEQLDALLNQQIYLLKQELQRLMGQSDALAQKIAGKITEQGDIIEPLLFTYSREMSKLYLKGLQKKRLQLKCDSEESKYESKLNSLREKIGNLELDILDS